MAQNVPPTPPSPPSASGPASPPRRPVRPSPPSPSRPPRPTGPAGAQAFTVGDVVDRLWRRPALAVVPLLLGLLVGVGYVLMAPPVYVASASVVVQPLLSDQFGNVNLASVINMATEAQVAASARVSALAAARLGVPLSRVRSASTADSPQGTQVLDVHYRAGTPAAAAVGAQTVAESYLADREGSVTVDADRRLAAVERQIEDTNLKISSRPSGQVTAYQESLRALLADQRTLISVKATSGGRVITAATPPQDRVAPRAVVDVPIGVVAGGLVGLALAMWWPRRRRSHPVMGQLPRAPGPVRRVPVARSGAL